MCGSSFIWFRIPLSQHILSSVERMNDSIIHLGPDDDKVYLIISTLRR